MQTLTKIINNELTNKVVKLFLLIIAIPFVAYSVNLGLLAIYNLGYYSGTFLRNLYNFIS